MCLTICIHDLPDVCNHNIKRANGILKRLYMAGLGNVLRGIPKEKIYEGH